VLVQASVYGTDNSVNIELLRSHTACNSIRKLRAITVFDEKTVTDETLETWDALGVRGFRINLESSGAGVNYTAVAQTIKSTAERVKKYANWKCQLYVSGNAWDCEFPFSFR
jgi:predicted TIM-barrel fold metal-dependent hydrolase